MTVVFWAFELLAGSKVKHIAISNPNFRDSVFIYMWLYNWQSKPPVYGCKYIGDSLGRCVLIVGLGVFFGDFVFSLHTSHAFMQKIYIFAT